MLGQKPAWLACWLAVELCCGLVIGCRTPGKPFSATPDRGSDPQSATQSALTHTSFETEPGVADSHALPAIESVLHEASNYAQLGERAKSKSDANTASFFAEASLKSWQALNATPPVPASESVRAQAWQLYRDSLANFMTSALRQGQIDPLRGVSVRTPDGQTGIIKIASHGFPWTLDDFNEIHLASEFQESKIARRWASDGIGVPLVVVRNRQAAEAHLGKSIPFAATAVLRPLVGRGVPARMASDTTGPQAPVIGVLDFYNPLQIQRVSVAGQQLDLARDISAPLAYVEKSVNRDNFQSFLRPGRRDDRSGLRMLEPYQPGKIPVVFVHGLLSDSVTWVNMVNDLRAVPWFNDRYQIWAFQYATGQAFLRSAAEMRGELTRVVKELGGPSRDPALASMILVGHSMGGLVSKQQVTSSGSAIWDSVANRPLNEIQATSVELDQIRSLFFFEPLPSVKRVVFVGTPHQGSEWATTLLGRVGAKLVRAPSERVKTLQQLMHDNPHVFSDVLTKGIPSSVDFLRPDSSLLMATYNRPLNPEVRLHSIIGTGRALRDGTPADGVVPVSSARHPEAISEKYVDATHTGLLDHTETSDELARILLDHLREFDARFPPR